MISSEASVRDKDKKHLCHSDLTGPNDIRLLRLDAGKAGDPIHGDFLNLDVIQTAGEYEALSYTWADENGDLARCKPIFLGDFWDTLYVTRNCEKALRAIRTGLLDLSGLMQSASIRMMMRTERSQQVNMMQTIYSRAKRVLVFLGDSSSDSDMAIEFLSHNDRRAVPLLCFRWIDTWSQPHARRRQIFSMPTI